MSITDRLRSFRSGLEVEDAVSFANDIVGESSDVDSPDAYWHLRTRDVVALLLLEQWLEVRLVAPVDAVTDLAPLTAQTIRQRFSSAGPSVLGFAEDVLLKHFSGPLQEQDSIRTEAKLRIFNWGRTRVSELHPR